MLVFTLRLGEKVMIGDQIEVCLVSPGKHHVRVGFAAPREIVIDREKIWHRKRLNQQDVSACALCHRVDDHDHCAECGSDQHTTADCDAAGISCAAGQ